MRYIRVFLCVALLSGCENLGGIFSSSDEADFYTDRAQYGSDEAITLTLSNRTAKKVLGYNLCSSTLEEFRAGKWQPAALESWVCTAVLYLLDPGKQASFIFDLEKPIPAGVYRFKAKIEVHDKSEHLELTTNEFRVR